MSKAIFLSASLLVLIIVASSFEHGHGGHSNTYRKQDGSGNYKFGYDIVDPKGAKNSRHEQGDAWGNKHGEYSLKDVDGRERQVQYIADKAGFRAHLKTNEPGTGNIDSADAIYNGADPHGHSNTHVTSGWENHHGHHGGQQGGHHNGNHRG
ncbi:adult-specific rigid cuticular protein 15.7-like [Panonychus citri]|uniref:adult-specific rigid cuticular protein 15.7-like n=1 Tax=Panonychus citri TaxID=50023 RepID=UPI00230832DD|nr:adult-specific rigid cuticular protein 15.7-like [Panonychus citri]